MTLTDFLAAHSAELTAGAPVFLPVNPCEYHGPHLSLLNDHHISVGLARDLHQRLAPAPFLVAPELGVGVDPTPGPGTVATPFAEVKAKVRAACAQLCDAGARKVVLMTFHGSPLHALALEAGVELCRSRGVKALSPLNILLHQLLQLDVAPGALQAAFAAIPDPAARERAWKGLALDFHGGFFETSVAIHYAPQTVRPWQAVPPCPPFASKGGFAFVARTARALGLTRQAQELDLAGAGMAWYALRPFPGYTGEPALASAAAGAAFAKAIIDLYADAAQRVLEGDARSPEPIFKWLGWLPFTPANPTVPLDAVWQPTA